MGMPYHRGWVNGDMQDFQGSLHEVFRGFESCFDSSTKVKRTTVYNTHTHTHARGCFNCLAEKALACLEVSNVDSSAVLLTTTSTVLSGIHCVDVRSVSLCAVLMYNTLLCVCHIVF